jgi:hypothetical protein
MGKARGGNGEGGVPPVPLRASTRSGGASPTAVAPTGGLTRNVVGVCPSPPTRRIFFWPPPRKTPAKIGSDFVGGSGSMTVSLALVCAECAQTRGPANHSHAGLGQYHFFPSTLRNEIDTTPL